MSIGEEPLGERIGAWVYIPDHSQELTSGDCSLVARSDLNVGRLEPPVSPRGPTIGKHRGRAGAHGRGLGLGQDVGEPSAQLGDLTRELGRGPIVTSRSRIQSAYASVRAPYAVPWLRIGSRPVSSTNVASSARSA